MCTVRVYRFDPLLHDGSPRSNETRAGRLQTGQAGALPIRIVPGDQQVLGGRPVQAAHIHRAETRVGRATGESRVRGQLRGPGEPRRRVRQQCQGQTITIYDNNITPLVYIYCIIVVSMHTIFYRSVSKKDRKKLHFFFFYLLYMFINSFFLSLDPWHL